MGNNTFLEGTFTRFGVLATWFHPFRIPNSQSSILFLFDLILFKILILDYQNLFCSTETKNRHTPTCDALFMPNFSSILSIFNLIAKLVPNCSLLSQPNDLNFPITINWFVLQILGAHNIYYLINSKYNRQVNWWVYFSDTYASSIKGDAEMSRYQEIVFGLHNFNAAKKLLLTKAIILFMTFE